MFTSESEVNDIQTQSTKKNNTLFNHTSRTLMRSDPQLLPLDHKPPHSPTSATNATTQHAYLQQVQPTQCISNLQQRPVSCPGSGRARIYSGHNRNLRTDSIAKTSQGFGSDHSAEQQAANEGQGGRQQPWMPNKNRTKRTIQQSL